MFRLTVRGGVHSGCTVGFQFKVSELFGVLDYLDSQSHKWGLIHSWLFFQFDYAVNNIYVYLYIIIMIFFSTLKLFVLVFVSLTLEWERLGGCDLIKWKWPCVVTGASTPWGESVHCPLQDRVLFISLFLPHFSMQDWKTSLKVIVAYFKFVKLFYLEVFSQEILAKSTCAF